MIAAASADVPEPASMHIEKKQDSYVRAEGEILTEHQVHRVSGVQVRGRKAPRRVEPTREAVSSSLEKSQLALGTMAGSEVNEYEGKQEIAAIANTQISPIVEERSEIVSSPETKEVSSTTEMKNFEIERSNSKTEIFISKAAHLVKSITNLKGLIQIKKPSVFSRSQLRRKTMIGPAKLPSSNKNDMNFRNVQLERNIDHKADFDENKKASIICMMQKIIEKIKDDKARRIGIYGKGGIGKTTVLHALVCCPEIQQKFDFVVQVTISRYWSRKKIQCEVLRQIGLNVDDPQSDVEIAKKLFRALQSRKFLLLLDDVWEWIDLEAIGIPQPGHENDSRIIVATRSAHICEAMAPDGQIEVNGIPWEEAWNLFQEQVGNVIDSLDIRPRAEAIVLECGGLPLLIIVIGKALAKQNNILAWRLVLSELLSVGESKSTAESSSTEDDTASVLQQLKVGYDRLQTDDLKCCFLYCALFPEDHKIEISELIHHWIQEGLISGSPADAFKKGQRIVKSLAEASLMECGGGGLSIAMHDMIRDLAWWIMLSEGNCYQFLVGRKFDSKKKPGWIFEQRLVSMPNSSSACSPEIQESSGSSLLVHPLLSRSGAGLTKPPEENEWEETEMIFLMDNDLSRLPESPNCPKLSMLFLQRNKRLATIPKSFFDRMPCLQVLNLSNTSLRSLPSSVFQLSRLRALVLRHCQCLSEIPPEVGNLELLELLDLHGTDIYTLPPTIGKLSLLKHLSVTFYALTDEIKRHEPSTNLIPPGVLLNLLLLEELNITVQPGDTQWNIDAEYLAQELCWLNKLNTLHIYFPEVKFLKHFIKSSPVWKANYLSKFKIVIGQYTENLASRVPKDVEVDYNEEDRCLRYVNGDGTKIPDEVTDMFMRATAFYLDHQSNTSSLSEFGIANIRQLRFCILKECPELLTVIHGSRINGSAFPNLVRLSLHYLWNLKSIWEDSVPDGSFNMLKILSVYTCPRLEYVLSQSMLQHLPSLEDLLVKDCASVAEIIKSETMIQVGVTELPKFKKLELKYLPQLATICNGSYHNIEQITMQYCPKLKTNSTSSQQ